MNHPLQSEVWGTFRRAMGIDVVRVNNWLLTFHTVPFTPFTIGYFPKGPLLNAAMLAILATLGKEKRAIFIQLEPNVRSSRHPERSEGSSPSSADASLDSSPFGFRMTLRPSHHPLFTKYTFVLDLTKSEEELLKAMHPKTRYNIKVAQKHGVVVREDNSSDAFDTYLSLTKETTSRQGFYAHNETYHRRMWEILFPAGIARLWTAVYQEKIVAAWIIFVWKDTMYYPYGASSREHRETMAPNLLLWEIVRWGKKAGYKKFDLWGALGPQADQNDPWYGFHRFKQGFGPELVEFAGSYDLVLNPLLYHLYTVADTIRWRILQK